MLLLIYQRSFFGSRTVGGKVCIGSTSIRKYIPIYINPMSNRNNIIWGCETCISTMLLQSDLNKWRLSQLEKLDMLYNNSASTRILQISKIYFIEYNNQFFSNNSHILWRACDTVSSYHCPYPITGSNIPKWVCILNFFLIFQGWMIHI